MLRYGFFDSEIVGYDEEGMPQFDRAESSDFLAMFLSCLVRSGVLAVPGDCFQVLAGEEMAVRVRPGFGVVEGRLAYDDEEAGIVLEAADAHNRRIDRVILRANYPDRKCEIFIRAGTPAADPQPPELVRDGADYFEMCLAEVAVRANQQAITQADITDTRADTDVCGWVTQAIQQVDTHTLFLQWQAAYQQFYAESGAEFDAWMEELHAILDGDAVSNLMSAIKENSTAIQRIAKELEKKPDAPTVVQATIMAEGWTGEDAPYENTVAVEGVTVGSIVEVALQARPTEEQVTACAGAMLVDGGQADGSITLRAMGDKPEVDLPVIVIIR